MPRPTRSPAFPVALFVALVAPRVGAQTPPGPAGKPPATTDLLRKAHLAFARYPSVGGDRAASDKLSAEIYGAFRQAAPGLPELSLAIGSAPRFVPVTLNDAQAGSDAARVLLPMIGQQYRLTLDLVVPGATEADSPLRDQGFLRLGGGGYLGQSRRQPGPLAVAGVALPAANSHYILDLGPAGRVDAGTKLLVWFDFKAEAPCPAFLRLRAEPIQPTAPPTTPALQAARATLQAGLDALSERYDGEIKALRRLYLTEVDKVAQLPATKRDPAEVDRIVAEIDRVNGGDAAAESPRGFRIVRAEYGEGDRWMDVTIPLRSLILAVTDRSARTAFRVTCSDAA